MNEEILKNIWDYLSTQGLTKSPFDEWSVNIQQDEGIQKNIHGYLVNQNLTDLISWTFYGTILPSS